MADPARPRRPSRRGLIEYLIVTGFFVLAAAGTVALWGDEIRAAFGSGPAPVGAQMRTGTGR